MKKIFQWELARIMPAQNYICFPVLTASLDTGLLFRFKINTSVKKLFRKNGKVSL